MQEKRITLRRESDRRLWAEVQERRNAQSGNSADKETRSQRRRAIRRNCSVRIAICFEQQSGNSDTWHAHEYNIKGKLLDLSEEGTSLFTAQQLDIAQKLSIQIVIDKKIPIAALAQVRWSKSIPEKGGFASGVKFHDVKSNDKKQLNKFLKQMDATVGL